MKGAKVFGILSMLLFGFSPAHAAEPSISNIEAQALSNYSRGEFKQAIKGFRKLVKHYEHKDEKAFIEYSILLANSQDATGFPIEACFSLHQIIDRNGTYCDLQSERDFQPINIPPSRNHLIVAITMANLLRDLGRFDRSNNLLNAAEEMATSFNDEQLIAGVQIGHGNLSFVQLKLKRDRLTYRDATLPGSESEQIESILAQIYGRYESEFESPIGYEAISKWLSVHEEHRKWLPFLQSHRLYQEKNSLYQTNLSRIANYELSQITQAEKAQFTLELATHFYEFGLAGKDESSLIQAFKRSRDVLAITENNELRSKAFGLIGKLYAYSEQYQEAILAYKRASESADNPYLWQYKQATLYEKLGDQGNAIKSYEASIANLAEVEWNVSPTTSEIRLNFQERTKPIYDDYLKLLLSQEAPNFQKILQTQQQFVSSELQNYLGCSSLQSVSATDLFEKEQNASIVYLFKSGQYYHTIAQNAQTFKYHRSESAQIDRVLKQTQILLTREQNSSSDTILKSQLEILYNNLFRPVESIITPDKPLLFALDSNFHQISLGMLFDGDRYLIEKNPIALVTPQLYAPQELSSTEKEKVFFAGISEMPEQYSEYNDLPHVTDELRLIQAETKLINQDFTKSRLIENLTKDRFIFHIASHGQFSSDPDETFVLSWDQKITLDSLSNVISDRAQNTPNPIELLVLSACESAKGDIGAFLGLAGITVQSGAKSTLASLWQAEDESSALLMADFYKFLRSGKSKAEALQLAQIEQIQQERSPHFWGNFVLVGSWR